MNLVRVDLRRLSAVTAVLVLVVFSVLLVIQGFAAGEVFASLLRSGVALTAAGLFWRFYDQTGWRTSGLRGFGWLSKYPDLTGRWEGTVCRNREDTPHPFVIEISQTFTSLSFTTFTRRSRGRSQAAWFTADHDGAAFGVVALWQTTSRDRSDPTRDETFWGTSVWRIEYVDDPSGDDDQMRIVDNYYTSRDPSTQGKVDVRRVSRKLRNGF